MRPSSFVWPGVVLTLAGIWLIVDGGWLTTNPSAGTYWNVGGALGVVLLLVGLYVWALSSGALRATSTAAPGAVGLARAAIPEAPSGQIPAARAKPDQRRAPQRVARKWTAVVGAIFVVLLVLGYLFATVPLAQRNYSVTIVTISVHGAPGSSNNSGSSVLYLPAGATLSGSWTASAGQAIQIFVLYGSGYANFSSSGSFYLGGASPYVYPVGAPLSMLFEVLSGSPVTVTISGSYSVPLLYL